MNSVQMLLHRAATTPDQAYLHQPVEGRWVAYSWREVADASLRMASALRGLGLKPGDCVGITGLNTAHWFMADFACAIAGLISVGIYPKQAAETVSYIARHCGLKAVFVGPMPDAAGLLGALPAGIIHIAFPYPGVGKHEHDWDSLLAQYPPAEVYARGDDEPLCLIYTSGTTGQPKGVIITQRNVSFTGNGLPRIMPARAGGEHLLSYLPLAHAFERGAVEVGSLYIGAEVWFLESIDKLPETLQHVRPTRFYAVPLVWSRLQAGILKLVPKPPLFKLLLRTPLVSSLIKRKIRKGLGLDRAWLRVSGAAPLPASIGVFFHGIGLDIYEGYGMTENSIYVSCNLPQANRPGSVGKPYPDSLIRIAADGEIQNHHAGVTPGYYQEPEKTAEIFTADGWLRTGDLGRLDSDGYLYVTGRIKETFKTLKGKYVTPAPIEGSFSQNPNAEYLCLSGSGLHQPVMLIDIGAQGHKADKAAVEKSLLATVETVNAGLEAHERIARVFITKDAWTIDNQQLTPTFKVRRTAVEKRYAELIQSYEEKREVKVVWEA